MAGEVQRDSGEQGQLRSVCCPSGAGAADRGALRQSHGPLLLLREQAEGAAEQGEPMADGGARVLLQDSRAGGRGAGRSAEARAALVSAVQGDGDDPSDPGQEGAHRGADPRRVRPAWVLKSSHTHMASISYMKRVLKDARASGIAVENAALLEKKIAVAEAVQGKIDALALPFCEATVAAGRCGEA